MAALRGSFYFLILYDVAEQIRLDRLREILGVQARGREPSFKHPAPEYVRFERPPAMIDAGTLTLETGEKFESRIKFFDYGVVSVQLEIPFEAGWEDLVLRSSRWISAPELEKAAAELARTHLARVQDALVQPYQPWLSEDYYVIQLRESLDDQGERSTAADLMAKRRGQIAQLIRGEAAALADSECAEAVQSSLSYYSQDLMTVGWMAAFVYDTAEGAAAAIQLLEYANTQLLEFRHYDTVLTRVLGDVYKMLERKGGLFRHWRMARQAQKLNAMRLDIMELTERADNAIKFLSDMFYARAYRMAAAKIGVSDYRNLVEQKLRTAGELYASMVNEFHQARSFVLEAMVVAILVIDLVIIFRGGK